MAAAAAAEKRSYSAQNGVFEDSASWMCTHADLDLDLSDPIPPTCITRSASSEAEARVKAAERSAEAAAAAAAVSSAFRSDARRDSSS
jgi:hypothetical protein